MKQHTVRLGGKTFELAFTMGTLEMIEEAIPDFDMSNVSKFTRRAGTMIDIVYAMARQGELLAGRKVAEDRAWFAAHIPASPRWIADIQIAVFNTISDAIKMENETEDGGEVDEVLEEIKKKDGTDA